MPSSCEFHKASIFEDSGITLMARIRGNNGNYIVQADFGTITYAVHDDDGEEVIAATSITVASAVFNTLQTALLDPRWPHAAPDVGYNFLFVVPAASFPTGDKTYYVEFKFVPTTGEPFHDVWEIAALNLRRS